MSAQVIYIDRSDVHEGDMPRLKAGLAALVEFVDANQPQMLTYGFHLDEQANTMTVMAVHPSSESLERHIAIGTPEFKKLAPYLTLREIEVFGRLTDRAQALLQQKAATLGAGGRVIVHERFAGFTR